MSVVQPAVTALLMCDGDLLMVRRAESLKIFAGYWAFPGGKLEAADHSLAAPAWAQGIDAVHAAALVREVQEETGVDLRREGLVTHAALLGRATTPPSLPVRFCTQFLRIDLAHRPDVQVCDSEIVGAEWRTPAEWWQAYQSGNLLLPPPTRDAIQALAAHPQATTLPGLDDDRLPEGGDGLRWLEPLAGLFQIAVRSNTLPPATHTNAWCFGDRYRVLVDPSPNSPEEYARLKRSIARIGVDEIFLTHHHPDHRQYANELAMEYDIPLAMSEDCVRRINALQPGWFGDLTVRTYAEGDVVTRWQGQPVRVMAVPGHDQGQLALMPDNRAWCLVSDLYQGIGTVVVSAPEGHMGRYFESLRRVIALDPKVLLPSHGQASGGTYRLREVLAHREAREAQMLGLYRAGLDDAAVLAEVYQDLNPALLPLAQRQVAAHKQKLIEEGHL